jgi:hypothetical protein
MIRQHDSGADWVQMNVGRDGLKVGFVVPIHVQCFVAPLQ